MAVPFRVTTSTEIRAATRRIAADTSTFLKTKAKRLIRIRESEAPDET
jgi:hypothetical protein